MNEEWLPKLKNYPHFDAPIPASKILDIVTDEKRVKENTFFPFLYYWDVKQKFGREPAKKRKIRYAARRDSYIYSYYRWIISKEYEALLKALSLEKDIIAYRKVPVGGEHIGNKSNIHFSHDAFSEIRRRKECIAIALDISNYFEMIDHAKLEKAWCRVMGTQELKADHKAVFRHITKYAEVSFDEVCRILEYKGDVIINDKKKFGFKRTISKKIFFTDRQYRQLCTPEEFRSKIIPAKIIEKNMLPYGIPQGSPISDILANINLLSFDEAMKGFCDRHNIFYKRYSDDLLFILPSDVALQKNLMCVISAALKDAGEMLKIKDTKTIIRTFKTKDNHQECHQEKEGLSKDASFDYLGFRYDGRHVSIKDGTMHNYFRKMTYGIRKEARWLVSRNKGKTANEIIALANFSVIYKKYGTIEDYRRIDFSLPKNKKKLTFIAYAQRALYVFRDFDNRILKQISSHKFRMRDRLSSEIKDELLKVRPQKI